MNLSELQNREFGIITKVRGRGAFRKRLYEMGFVRGKKVTVIKNAPLKDPVEYEVMGYKVSLRRSEAQRIEVAANSSDLSDDIPFEILNLESELKKVANQKHRKIHIALVGNPNSGKTSLFNFASRSSEHVGNYAGVTVDAKTTSFTHSGYDFTLTDLPGTYSLSSFTPEEVFVREYIHNQLPDIIINVVDASNIERNLFLTTQLIDMDIRVVMALNMYDEIQKSGDQLDYPELGKMIGIPIVPTIGAKGRGVKELLDKTISVYQEQDETQRHIHINYGEEIETAIKNIQKEIKKPDNYNITDIYSSRFLAVRSLENDIHIRDILMECPNYSSIKKEVEENRYELEKSFNDKPDTVISDSRYGFVAGALKETYKKSILNQRKTTEILDAFFTHKLFGYPIFLFFLWIMFQGTFVLGNYPMEWIDMGVTWLREVVGDIMPAGPLRELMLGGIIDGVGGVIVFLPNILILYFFISLLEDTGYMARTAFLMDKLMHKIGLHGKSFIPLIMGFGCNVPAILSTRTIENRNNRMITMLINPFMSCSARLPVYILLIGAFFEEWQGTMLFIIYFTGILLAIIMAMIFRKFLFDTSDEHFVMELPPYRVPTFRAIIKHMWGKASEYLKKIGGVILIASIIIWVLENYPKDKNIEEKYTEKIEHLERIQTGEEKDAKYTRSDLINIDSKIHTLKLEKQAELQANSYIGRVGHFIEPVLRPLGFDWRIGVSLLSGVAAKEIVISTMAVIFQADPDDLHQNESLQEKLQHAKHQSGKNEGKKLFTPFVAFGLLMFILIYFPCLGVLASIYRESNSMKWPLFVMIYTTFLAWFAAFIVHQIGNLFL